ncbi:MAG: insulinase family protein [Desulfobacteraceae bacterium]|nr:insulinase family protein [Desulfobacteraceae bacterium]
MANFLEYLAFSGSRHFPDNSLLSHLESLGMEIGKNINAYTEPAEIIFALSFAHARENSEVLGLRIFSDVACGLSLSPEQIPRERSVVLEEMRLKQTASSARGQKMLEVMFHLVVPMLNSRLKRILRQKQGRVYDLYCAMHANKAYPSFRGSAHPSAWRRMKR